MSSTTPALPSKSGLRFVTILTLVTLAHALVIILLLAHFGWLNGVGIETDDNAGQSGFVIPVTLEKAGDEENKLEEKVETKVESTPELKPEPTPDQETKQEPVQVPSPEPTTEHVQEKAPTESETFPPAAPPTETQNQTMTDVEKEIPLAAEPETQPAATQPVMPPETSQTTPPTPAPLTAPAPAPVSPPTTSPQTTAPFSPKPATIQTLRGESLGNSSSVALTDTANESLPTTPAQVDPNYLHRPNPVYPAVSKRLREAGTVLLRVSLDAAGTVSVVTVQTTSDYPRLDQAAIEAVRQWRFIPATRGQQAIASTVLVPIEFKHQ